MKSKTKWLLVGPVITAISFTCFLSILGNWSALVFAPLCGLGIGLWGYGWFEKNDVGSKFFDYMDKDD